MKKLTAIVLTFIISLSCFSVCIAAEASQTEEVKSGNETMLESLGITLPHAYSLNDSITREDFVYLMMKTANIPCSSQAEYLDFPDVKLDAWSHDAIVTARALGYVTAKADESFGVSDTVSVNYATDLAMKILGFHKIEQMKYARAYTNLIYACNGSDSLSYAETFDVLYTMLLCPYVDVAKYSTAGISYEIVTEKAFIEKTFEVEKISGRLTGNRYSKIGGGYTDVEKIEVDGVPYVSICGDLNEYLGFYGDFFITEKDSVRSIIAVNIADADKEYNIGNGELFDVSRQENSIRLDYESDGKERKISVPLSCDLIYNGKITDFSLALIKELIDTKSGEIRIVEQRDYCTVIVTAYETVIVDGVSQNTKTITGKYGEKIVLPDWEYEENYVSLTKDGAEITLSEIVQGDVLMIARTDGYAKIKVTNHSLAGIVTKLSGDTVSIDKVDYEYSLYYKNTAESAEHKIESGMEATFFFDEYGKIIDFDDENIVYPGEYMFLVGASKEKQAFDYECKVLVVTMNAQMQTLELADTVKTDIGSSNVDASVIIDRISGKKELIYIEKNKDGKISKLLTDGSRLVSMDAAEKKRKFKRGSGAFLIDTNDANFPEFFTSDATVALQIPVSTASNDDFLKIENYQKITLSAVLKDAENATVQAYNFDDFICPEIVLLRKEIVADTTKNANLHLVVGFGKEMNAEGEIVSTVHTWSNGAEQTVILADEEVMNCTAGNESRAIIEGDIVRFFYNNAGTAFVNEWIDNIDTGFKISAAPTGRNDGNAYVTGTVEDKNDRFIKIKLSGGDAMVCMPTATVKVTVYDEKSKTAEGRSHEELAKGDLVMFRLYYTSIQDIILKTTY